MGLSIYHVGFVRSANYFFQRLQGFTPAGVAASRAPALPLRSWGLLVPSTMCDGTLLPPLVLSLLLLVWGLDPGTGSVPSSRGHLPGAFPKHPGARVHGWTADSIPGGGKQRPRVENWSPVPPQHADGSLSPGAIEWLRRLREARLGEGRKCGVTAACYPERPASQRRRGRQPWWPGRC